MARSTGRDSYKRDRMIVGGVITGLLVVSALFGPAIVAEDPIQISLEKALEPPSWQHPFGRDALGRDLLARTVYGARLACLIVVCGVMIGAAAGVWVGIWAGYAGGFRERVVVRVIDVLLAFPGFLLALAAATLLGPGTANLIIAVGFFSFPTFARVARAMTLSLKQEPYVTAAITRRDRPPHHRPSPLDKRSGTAGRPRSAPDGRRNRHGFRPILPGPGPPCTDARMGGDARCRQGVPLARPAAGLGSRRGALLKLIRTLSPRRWIASQRRPALSVVAGPYGLTHARLEVEVSGGDEQQIGKAVEVSVDRRTRREIVGQAHDGPLGPSRDRAGHVTQGSRTARLPGRMKFFRGGSDSARRSISLSIPAILSARCEVSAWGEAISAPISNRSRWIASIGP